MSKKFNLEEIRDNLSNLKNKLEKKDRDDGFWVVASRSDFKPIKIEETIGGKKKVRTIKKISEIKKDLLDGKEQYFKGKILASIHFVFKPFIFSDKTKYSDDNYDEIKDKSVVTLIIDIYKVDDNGQIDTNTWDTWECRVNFTIDDLTKHKLKYSDSEIIMRQVAANLIRTVDFYGVNFKDYVKIVKKNLKKIG